GGWGQDDLIPELYQFLLKHKISLAPEAVDLGFIMVPPGFGLYDYDRGRKINWYAPGFPYLLHYFLQWEHYLFFINPFLVTLWSLVLFAACFRRYYWHFILCSSIWLFEPNFFNNTLFLIADTGSFILILSAFFGLSGLNNISFRKRAFFAGGLYGLSILFRYPNIIAGPALMFLLFLKRETWFNRQTIRVGLLFIGGLLLFGIIPLLIYHQRLFGTIFQTTYTHFNPPLFKYFFPSLQMYASYSLPAALNGLIILSACYSVYVMSQKNRHSFQAALAGSVLVATYILFYACFTYVILDRRYVIPALAIGAVGFAIGLLDVVKKIGRNNQIIMGVVTLATAGIIIAASVPQYQVGDRIDHDIFREIRSRTERDAIIIAKDWSGTIRHYCQRRSFHFWTHLAVLDLTCEYLLENNIPTYILMEYEDDIVFDYLSKLAQRFVLKEVSLNLPDRKIWMYQVLGYATEVELSAGLIIPLRGSQILFDHNNIRLEGPGIAYSLVNFASPRKNVEGIILRKQWAGFLFRLMPEYRVAQQQVVLHIEYKDESGDFIIHGTDPDSAEHRINLENTGRWKTIAVPVHLTAQHNGEIRIQNDDDQDLILIRKVSLTPALPGKYAQFLSQLEHRFLEREPQNVKTEMILEHSLPPGSNEHPLLKQLKSPLPRVRALALLRYLNSDQDERLDLPTMAPELLKDPYYLVRYYTLLLLQDRKLSPQLLTRIGNCLQDEIGIVQLTALKILLENDVPESGPIMLQHFKSKNNYWEEEAFEKILSDHRIPFQKRIYRVGGE
ncbi:HEAT repeat domain-containing protein, partial [candidate division CSSED10-310 bacterium]